MSEQFAPNPEPSLHTSELTGEQMDEPFIRLSTFMIDRLNIDGVDLIYVQDAVHDRQSGVTTVACLAADETQHIFTYRPTTDSPVFHVIEP